MLPERHDAPAAMQSTRRAPNCMPQQRGCAVAQGVPLRMELGPKDLEKGSALAALLGPNPNLLLYRRPGRAAGAQGPGEGQHAGRASWP